MISHKHKFIFIHIPKCAGSSITNFYFNTPKLDWRVPNYDFLYGWCPIRKIHLQHATTKELLELDLISPKVWNSYFKFTFVRNPFDRAYSDYLWIMNDRKIIGSFRDYINRTGNFKKILNSKDNKNYRGDHLNKQTTFFDLIGKNKIDLVGRFENLHKDINKINLKLGIEKSFDKHSKKNTKRYSHYSLFFSQSKKKLVEQNYNEDFKLLHYNFVDKKTGFSILKNWI